MLKKLLKIIITVIVLLPIALYIFIVVANNSIASDIEKELKRIELPSNTQLVDTFSIAGKITGSGNGMQYFGAILVSTEISQDQLQEYYQKYSEDIYVVKQETEYVFDSANYRFNNFDSGQNNYMVYSWEYNTSDWEENGFFAELLDLDLRGH